MKKILTSYILISLFPCLGFAQDVDYYKNLSDSSTDILVKLTAMDSVIAKTFRKNDDVFVEYSMQYIELAKSIDSIEFAAKKAMNLQPILTTQLNKPTTAVRVINGVLVNKSKIKDSFLLGGLYLKRGKANAMIDLKMAIKDYDLALNNFSKNDSIYLADVYLFKGQAYSNLGQFVPAGENYHMAFIYYEALEDYPYMVYAQQGITTMFSMNGFYEKAKIERLKIIAKLQELGLDSLLTLEYYNQALDYEKLGNSKLQLEYLKKASANLNAYDKEGIEYSRRIMVHSNLAEYYSTNKEIDLATAEIKLLGKWINYANDIYSKLSYFGAIGTYHFALGEFDAALEYAEKKLESALAYNYTDAILESYRLLSDIYAQKGDFKNSLDNNQHYLTIKDSIYNRSTANALAYYQTLYETEKKEKELVEKNTAIQLLEKDNDAFKKVAAFSSLALLFFFGLILLYRNQNNLKNNKLLQEKFSQKLLVLQEDERKRISKDLHDGIGQRLLLIKNKVIATGDEATKKMIDYAIDEVRTITRDLHPFQLQEMGITKAIQHTIREIDENTALFISSEIDNIDNLFSPSQEVNIYRIVQESLNNILKHAKAEASKVGIKKMSNCVVISIKDNGEGFVFSEKYHDVRSLGLKTLRERTKFLNGQMKVQSKINGGTSIEFQFPIQ